jgi:hypothetical protein
MKLVASTLLFLFITYLSTPSIIMWFENNADVSIAYDFSEEDNQNENKEVKEIKSDFTFKTPSEFIVFTSNYSKNIISENESKHDAISEEIFIPPPKLI